jgi:hypothetical protein
VLDDAPTYVNFLKLAEVRSVTGAASVASGASVSAPGGLLEVAPLLVIAVSLGAVFFGAMT